MNIPTNLKYTNDDEWIRLEGEVAFVGITDYAQHELGDITFVDIDPDIVGETLDAQEEFGAIEAVKTTAELLMPVAGEIVEVNEATPRAKPGSSRSRSTTPPSSTASWTPQLIQLRSVDTLTSS